MNTITRSFFIDEPTKVINKVIDNYYTYNIWTSVNVAKNLPSFTQLITKFLNECDGKSEAEQRKIAVAARDEIDAKASDFYMFIRNDMISLHKVKKFFRSKAKAKRSICQS